MHFSSAAQGFYSCCTGLTTNCAVRIFQPSVFSNHLMSSTWSLAVFAECYNAIKFAGPVDQLVTQLAPDLGSLLVVPNRSNASREKINLNGKPSKTVSVGDEEYELNAAFVETASQLASDLDLDELHAVEVLLGASDVQSNQGTDLLDSGKLEFFMRYEYILNIVGYLISEGQVQKVGGSVKLFDTALQSYTRIYSLLLGLNDQIDKQKVTADVNNLQFVNSIIYTRARLFELHELLLSILVQLVDHLDSSFDTYKRLVEHVKSNVDDDDVLVAHYLPVLIKLVKTGDHEKFHSHFSSVLNTDYAKVFDQEEVDLTKLVLKPFEVLLHVVFFTHFISWCKEDDQRSVKYDFRDDIVKYINMGVNYGVMEKLLTVAADSTHPQTHRALDLGQMFEFRLLLQRHFPPLSPKKFTYRHTEELAHAVKVRPDLENVARLIDVSGLVLSTTIRESLLAPLLHDFFSAFVNNAAVVLMSLRDSEEDFLLSSINKRQFKDKSEASSFDHASQSTPTDVAEVDLAEITPRADLERFYLSFVYTYSHRPELSDLLWSDELVGLINWGLGNNTSPLITATFCLMISSLATSAGTATRVWDILANNNSLKKNDYSKISIDLILDSLDYYVSSLYDNFESSLQAQLNTHKLDLFALRPEGGDVIIDLAENSLVFISGFVQLMAAVVRHATPTIREIAFARFEPAISGFLRFDNLIVSSQSIHISNQTKTEAIRIYADEESRTVLLNVLLNFLAVFASDDLTLRHKVWDLVDRWLCHTLPDPKQEFESSSKLQYSPRKLKIHQGFSTNLTQLSQVRNFTHLVQKLLQPTNDPTKAFHAYCLAYPADLGAQSRPNGVVGVWPYIEYLLKEVFAKSTSLSDTSVARDIQLMVLETVRSAIEEIDWKFILTAPDIVYDLKNIDTLFDGVLFAHFVKLHHSLAVLNYLLEEGPTKALFSVVCLGNETIANNGALSSLVQEALQVVLDTLEIQNTFRRLLPTIKAKELEIPANVGVGTSMSLVLAQPKSVYDNIYHRGLDGQADLNESLLFNLQSVVHFALYIGSDSETIAGLAIKILRHIAKTPVFTRVVPSARDPLLERNRLLTVFESIDESVKIKYAFIGQINNLDGPLAVKYALLRFLNENVANTPTVAHFLLGYEIRGGVLRFDAAEPSLLRSLIDLLAYSLELVSNIDYANGSSLVVDVGPARLAALILSLVVKLCRHSISSNVTLQALRDFGGLFTKLLNTQPNIDAYTVWNSHPFNPDLSKDNAFVDDNDIQLMVEFLEARNMMLQYLSLELHDVSSKSKQNFYIEALLSGHGFLNGSAKVLSFLDVLGFSFTNFDSHRLEENARKYNLDLVVGELANERVELVQTGILAKTYKVLCSSALQLLVTADAKQEFAQSIMLEASDIEDLLTKHLVVTNLKEAQLRVLHSWVQVIQVLVTKQENSDGFILEVLQLILPKINDFFESDPQFAEELVSLCVLLFDVYERGSSDNDKLIPLFKTCINGILSGNSTPSLRADLYILLNRFLQSNIANAKLVDHISTIFKSIDKKFIDTVCNDSIYSEGTTRVTSIVFLESLIHVSRLTLDVLIHNNGLQLLVRSLKRTDEILATNDRGVNLETLLYELTAFKCTLCLLVRVSQLRQGASHLIQSELFPILKQLQFLAVDPDLGVDLHINADDDHAVVNLALDLPLAVLADDTVSYYEFLVPVFQLVAGVLVSMGPSYKPSITQSRELLQHFNRIEVGVLKRDVLAEQHGENKPHGLDELVRLFTILDALTHS